jgi:hypothetical protein
MIKGATLGLAAALAFPAASASAALKTPSAQSYLTSGCQILASVTPSSGDAAIARAFRSASVRFDKAAAKDVSFRPVAQAARRFLTSIANNDQTGATAAVVVVARTCTTVGGVDLARLWGGAPPATTPAGPTTTVIPPIAIAAPPNAPGSDPRNSAVNQALKDVNNGLPYNLQIPRGFTPNYDFPEFGRTFEQAGREDITALAGYFRDQCLNIGWPVLKVEPPTNLITKGGTAVVGAYVWCRSPDGGGAGQAAPWQLEITIFTFPKGGTIFGIDLHK